MASEQESKQALRSSADERKADKIAEIILRSRSALGLDHLPMTEEMLDIKVEEFSNALSYEIPIDRLDDVYREAMRLKENSYDLSVTELNQAWRSIQGREFKVKYFQCIGCADKKAGKIEICPFHKR